MKLNVLYMNCSTEFCIQFVPYTICSWNKLLDFSFICNSKISEWANDVCYPKYPGIEFLCMNGTIAKHNLPFHMLCSSGSIFLAVSKNSYIFLLQTLIQRQIPVAFKSMEDPCRINKYNCQEVIEKDNV